MGLLKHNDYIKILNYYDIHVSPKDSSKTIKNKAENILSEKLCKCIKKIKKDDRGGNGNGDSDGDGGEDREYNENTASESESKAVAICSNSIFQKKGIERGNFICKKHPKLLNLHGKNYALTKRKRMLLISRRKKILRNFQTKRKKLKTDRK